MLASLKDYAGTFFTQVRHLELDYSHIDALIKYLSERIESKDFDINNVVYIGAAIEELESIKTDPYPETYRNILMGLIIHLMIEEDRRKGANDALGGQRYPHLLDDISERGLFDYANYRFGHPSRSARIDQNNRKNMLLHTGSRVFLPDENEAHLDLPATNIVDHYFPGIKHVVTELAFANDKTAVDIFKKYINPESTLKPPI